MTVALALAGDLHASTLESIKVPVEEPKLIASIKKPVKLGDATYVFKLYSMPTFSNWSYRLDVCSEDGTRVLQSEQIRNGVSIEDKTDNFQIIDADNDGYLDIKIFGGTSGNEPWYKVWLYEPATRRFVWNNGNGTAAMPVLLLNLRSDKSEYKVGDEIQFTLTLKNIAAAAERIYLQPHDTATLFGFKDAQGRILPVSLNYITRRDVMWAKEDFRSIKPGENFEWVIHAKLSKKLGNKNIQMDFKDSSIVLDFDRARVAGLSGTAEFNPFAHYQGWDGMTTDEQGKPIRVSEKLGMKNVFTGSLTSWVSTVEVKEK